MSGFHPNGRRNFLQLILRPCAQKLEVVPPKIEEFLLIDRQTTLSQKGFEGGWDRRGLGAERGFAVFTWVHMVVRNLRWCSSCCVRLIFVILFDNVVYNIVWGFLIPSLLWEDYRMSGRRQNFGLKDSQDELGFWFLCRFQHVSCTMTVRRFFLEVIENLGPKCVSEIRFDVYRQFSNTHDDMSP